MIYLDICPILRIMDLCSFESNVASKVGPLTSTSKSSNRFETGESPAKGSWPPWASGTLWWPRAPWMDCCKVLRGSVRDCEWSRPFEPKESQPGARRCGVLHWSLVGSGSIKDCPRSWSVWPEAGGLDLTPSE